jgi:competence protein ComEA
VLDELPTAPAVESPRQRVAAAWAAVRSHPRPALAAVAAVLLLGVALWWLLRPPPPIAPEQLLPVVSSTEAPAAAPPGGEGTHTAPPGPTSPAGPPSTIVVHVAGAVVRPGVLRLPTGSRIVDAIDAAGGALGDADVDRVNLAAPVDDGAWIHVPRAGEPLAPAPAGGAGGAAPGSSGASSASSPLDLNAAGVEELDTLPGVGPATAAAIVEHRTRNGPFTEVDALTDVPGIGPAKLARLRALVRV